MIDPHSPHPRFYQLYLQLRDRIIAGEFAPLQPIPSQQQLMEAYGVSLITVRRALERLTAEGYITREHGRGCFVMPQANWLPNRQRIVQIGIIVSSIPNSFFPEIIAGVESFFAGREVQLVIAHSRWDPELEQSQISHFLDQGCAGLLISPSQTVEAYRALKETGTPFVFFNHYYPDPTFNFVITDDRTGAYQAARHLLALGHRRIGAIIGGRGKQTALDREEGLRTALEEAGFSPDETWFVRLQTFTYEEGRTGMATLLDRHPDLTAVFCSSEILAVGAAAQIGEMGRRIPEDISLVAFGDSDTSRFFHIPLTTVHQPTHEMGAKAAEMLWGLINGTSPVPDQIRLPCHLVIRDSTGPVPASSPLSSTS
ncbi:MAG: substrate-binding domain-containing protein [Firmicutes bacterium]|nr:substrate-binding domain-containing protein [Bacillota bacterium]